MSSQEIAWLLKEKYHGEKTPSFYLDVTRLESGEPLAYIIGSIPFLNANIYLDSRPLIPRVETEFLVDKVIEEISKSKSKPTDIKILDLCAGSGCIGVAIAKAFPTVKIDFIEFDSEHLSTIKKNCSQNNLDSESYRIFQGDLFNIKSDSKLYQYDYIISNPPYIDPTLNRTDNSVRDFEPSLALYGGEKGMELIEQIILKSPKYLVKGGQLWIEHEPEQVELIENLSNKHFKSITHTDQYQLKRFTKLVLQ